MGASFAAIVCAAGASKRFGGKRKKPFVDVAGRAAFLRSIELFAERDDVKQVLLGIPQEDEELVKMKWGAALSFHGAKVFIGGAQRFETVAKGLEQVDEDVEFVIVHDAARCCVTKEWLNKVLAKAEEKGAAMLACAVKDTIKRAEGETIVETIDRANLYAAQTPQVFRKELLQRAYANLKNMDASKVSDDSQLVEALAEKVWIVETDASNIKITQGSDIKIAEAIIKGRPKPKPKGPMGPYFEAQW